MPDKDVPPAPDQEEPTARQLGEHLATLVGGQAWEVDTEEALHNAPPPETPVEAPRPQPNRPRRSKQSRAKEESTPPTPEQIVEALLSSAVRRCKRNGLVRSFAA